MNPFDAEYAKLPRVSEIDHAQSRQRIIALLECLDQVSGQLQTLEKRDEELKLELQQLQTTTGVPGFRYGFLCFTCQDVKGRATFDADRAKTLLLEAGVAPEEVKALTKTGKPSVRRVFKRLEED